jgi:hypothetical protein
VKQLLHPIKPLPFNDVVTLLVDSDLQGITAIVGQLHDDGFKVGLILYGAAEAVVIYHNIDSCSEITV